MSAAVAASTGKPVIVKRAIYVSLASFVALAVVAGLLLSGGDPEVETGGGARFENFSLADVRDPSTEVSVPEGRPTVLYFFASWCIPCRKEIPVVQEVFESRDDVAIVGVNSGDHIDDARPFMAKYGATFPAAHDPGATVSLANGWRGLPLTAFIDENGRVDSVLHGEVDREELESRIDALVLQERAL